MTLKFNEVRGVSRYIFVQNIIKLSLCGSWVSVLTNFLSYPAMVKNPKIWFLWPLPLTH